MKYIGICNDNVFGFFDFLFDGWRGIVVISEVFDVYVCFIYDFV